MSGDVTIKGGTGKQTRVGVTDKNQLEVKATQVSEIAEVSLKDGKAFQYHFKHTMNAANTFEFVGTFEYTGSKSLILDNVIAAREDANLTGGNGQAHFDFSFGTTYTSGGTALTPFTLNAASNETLDATAYTAVSVDIVANEANAEKLFDLITENSVDHDFKDAIVLQKGNTLTIKAQSKNIGDVMHVALFMYEV